MKIPRLLSFLVAALCMVAAAVLILIFDKPVAAAACCGTALLALLAAWYSVLRSLRTVSNGFDLLRSQDFASRLRRVGQPDADRIVDLFNSAIQTLKAERLRNLEQTDFLSKLIEATPMGVAVCTFDGAIESENPAFVRLKSPALTEALAALKDGERVTIRPHSGQVLRCARLHFMDRGFYRPFYLVERLTDEIVSAEADVFHKIVRTMGHEVNNTLGGVVSVLETMADIHEQDRAVAATLNSCRDSCLKLGDFVRGYADVAKLPDPEFEPVDLHALAAETLPFVRQMCPAGIEVSLSRDEGPARVMADPMLLQRVVVNAVKNAAESIAGGKGRGRIVLRTAGRVIEIVDDGPGISPDAAGRLFTPFFSTKQPDRGLGLMLIADIVRRHHGRFDLSTGADGLTRLTVTLNVV